jgi:GntR family transcriptional regulator of vanillate catabolism
MDSSNHTLSASVTDRLRRMILSGELSPQSHLREQELSKQLGVSRTPVRDALLILAKEGLLKFSPYRGYVIREFKVSDILDAYELRAILEGAACRIAAENGLARDARAAINDALAETEAILGAARWTSQDKARWCELNAVFHSNIVAACGNPQLAEAIERTRTLPIIYQEQFTWFVHEQMIDWFDDASRLRSHDDHCRILDAIVNHQGGLAEQLMRDHILAAAKILKQNWANAMAQSIRNSTVKAHEQAAEPRRPRGRPRSVRTKH